MQEGRGPKRPPYANRGCNSPNSSSGQWNYPPPPPRSKLLDLDRLLEDAVCFCNKGCWRDYILKKETQEQDPREEAQAEGGDVRWPRERPLPAERVHGQRRSNKFGACGVPAPTYGGVPADVTGFLGTSFLSQFDSNA